MRCLVDVAKGLVVLHSNNLAYKRLSPENIVIDKEQNFKLANVLLSQILEHSPQITDYTCPELSKGESNELVEKSGDVWALGCILYEMCTFKVNL